MLYYENAQIDVEAWQLQVSTILAYEMYGKREG